MSDHIVVLVTAGSEDEARRISKGLLEKKLAACVNILPVSSLYMWEGKLQDDSEVLMIIKSTSAVFKEKLVQAVETEHSYDLPEIIGLPIVLGSTGYLQWISDEVTG